MILKYNNKNEVILSQNIYKLAVISGPARKRPVSPIRSNVASVAAARITPLNNSYPRIPVSFPPISPPIEGGALSATSTITSRNGQSLVLSPLATRLLIRQSLPLIPGSSRSPRHVIE